MAEAVTRENVQAQLTEESWPLTVSELKAGWQSSKAPSLKGIFLTVGVTTSQRHLKVWGTMDFFEACKEIRH